MNTILYTRVSTDEQANSGFSLRHQEQILTTYCNINDLRIIKHFQDDYSAKNFNRPQWKELMKFVKNNKNSIDKILFTKWDRFSRNIEEALTVIRELTSMGIIVNSIEQPLDLTNPDNKVMLAMYLMLPEVENDKNSQRTKDGMRRAKKEGCYLAKAPFGYSNAKVFGKTSLEPNNDAKVVWKAFDEVAKGAEAVEVIRKKFKIKHGVKIGKQQFYNMLRNVTYCGLILVPEYKKEPSEIIKALHESIVDEKLFKRVQNVLDGRKNPNAKLPSSVNDAFPLRGNLLCPKCGKLITASKSKGNGGHYEYYHCTSKCKVRYTKQMIHDNIKKLLDEVCLNPNVAEAYKSILIDVIANNESDYKRRKEELKNELKSVSSMLDNIEDKYAINQIAFEAYSKMTLRYNEKINELKNKISNLEDNDENLMKYVNNSVNLLCQTGVLFNLLENSEKGCFLRAIFPENLIVENGGFRTASMNEVLELLTRKCKGSQSTGIKKAIPKNGFSTVAPPLGLEPRTL